jgi:inner membrane protein
VHGVREWPVPVVGLLDEPAHLATAWLALAALAPLRTPRGFWPAALVASVAIDVDHVPLYLTDGAFAVDGGRPPVHSLTVVLVLAALAGVARGQWLLGAAAGMLLHLVRDLATGPGVPLLWPLADSSVRVPYWAYAVVVLVLAVVAWHRAGSLRAVPVTPRS